MAPLKGLFQPHPEWGECRKERSSKKPKTATKKTSAAWFRQKRETRARLGPGA